ncbi:MAG: Do family serine endopeptidase [Myxococcota bacterium]
MTQLAQTWAPQASLVAAALSLLPVPSFAAPGDDPTGSSYIADVVEKVIPAVVNITTEKTRRPSMQGEGFPPFFRDMTPSAPRRERGAGSGVVITGDGFIVTNSHVVADTDTVRVTFADGRSLKAKVMGFDKPADIALIKIDGGNFTHLDLGDSTKLRLGETVIAIGNPFGLGQTVTRGIVSAKGRAGMGIVDYEDFIQTDAAINPGNSGGALVNLRGELVGINSAILSRNGGSNGIGFAVPTTMVRPIIDQLKASGHVRRGFMGIGIQDLTPDLAESLGVGGDLIGVLVNEVRDDGPAAKADLKTGDVIVGVNGKQTRTASELRNTIAILGPGAKAKIDLVRDGKKRNVTIGLVEKKDEEAGAEQSAAEESLVSGLNLRDLNEELRRRVNAPPGIDGVVVVGVQPGSPAQEAGLNEGDVITHIDRKKVNNVGDLKGLALESKDKVLLRVWRQGSSQFVVLRK